MAIKNVLGETEVWEYVATNKQPINVLNVNKRTPSLLLLDTSGSTHLYEALIKRLTCQLYDDVLKDPLARDLVELSIVTFSSDVCIVQPLSEIRCQEIQGQDLEFHCEGLTLLGSALQAALLQLEQRIDQYNHAVPVIKHTIPILFLISDGWPTASADLREREEAAMAWSKQYIKERVAANKLAVIAVEIGNSCNHKLMRELTGLPDDRHVLRANNSSSLKDFFHFSSSMLVTCSSVKKADEELNEKDLRDYKNYEEM